MSDIWSLIKQGKEKLVKEEKPAPDFDDLDFMVLKTDDTNADEKEPQTETIIPVDVIDFPPWMSRAELFDIRKLKNFPIFQLHEELVALVKWLEPTPLDLHLREIVYHDLKDLFAKEIPGAILHPFGSFLTNLALPDSDLDIMVECDEGMNYLRVVEKMLRRCSFASRILVISHARVPIIKFRHRETGIDVDLSFNQDSSLLTSCYVIRQLDRYPHLRPMIIILKYMLSQRELNDTYHGGIGSFMITLLCLSCEQWCLREGIERGNLGNHLLEFFYYYGLLLNYDKLVLRVRNDGGYVTKMEKGWYDEERDYMLSVENPIDPSLDVGKSSYNIKRFKAFCSHALMSLTYNISQAEAINQSADKYFLQGIIRHAPRYSPAILASPLYQKYSKPGLLLPDVKAEQQELIRAHMEAVKRCKETDLKRVYELDYATVMGISPKAKSMPNANEKKEKKKNMFSQQRAFSVKGSNGGKGQNKKYRRF